MARYDLQIGELPKGSKVEIISRYYSDESVFEAKFFADASSREHDGFEQSDNVIDAIRGAIVDARSNGVDVKIGALDD